MAKKSMLEQARKAYNKSASTKYRVQANGKRTKKKKEKVKSHYGNIQKKTENTEENRREARNQTKNVAAKVGSNVVKKKTTESKPTTTGTNKQNGRRSGAITSVSSKSAERRTGAATARTTAKNVGNAVKTSTNLHKTPLKVTDVTQGTAKGTVAGTAYNKSKAADKALQKAGEKKTLTVSREQLTAEQKAAQERAARQTRFYTNSLVASGRMTQKQADDAVEKARKNAKKGVKEDHTLTYSNSAQSNETVQRVANASKFANTEVEDKKAAEKAMREARFYANSQVAAGKMTQKEADRLVKQAGKGHRTTQSANILDKLGGEGEAERQGTRQAGQLNDSKFVSGVMQGLSYADNTRAVGKYNKQAAELVDTVKQSGAFNTGYMVGQAGQFMLGGTGKMTDALVKGVAKSGAARSALNIGLRKAGADVLFESPINALDAVKMSTDANGNFDKNAFVKYMALNTGLSGGMGGLIGGAGSKLAKNDAKAYITLSAKANSGAGLTEQEKVRLVNLQKKMESIRNGNDVANTDIVNKADYDAEVSKKVFEKGGTVDDAIKVVNGGGTHTEKIGYANSIKETANAEFERLRVAREQMLEQARNTTPEEAKLLRQEASKLSGEITRLGEIANTAEKQLAIELKRNKKAVTELTQNVKAMSEATGINYRVVNDKDMKKLISEAGGDVSDDYFYKGFYYKNKNGKTEILINSDSPQAHQTVIGHETGHLIKSANEKEFDDLGNMLEEYAKKNDDFDAVYNQLKRSYPEASEAELREEVTCELLGRYVYGADDKFIKQLAGEKPSVVQRIVGYLKKLVSGTSDKEMSKELQVIIDKTEGLVKSIDSDKPKHKYSKEQKPPQGGSFDAEVEKAFEDAAVEEVSKEIQTTKKHQELLNHITDDNGNITREADMEYGDAVKRGDMETAQEYVDAALESKGYKYDAYHGSDAFGFTEFDLGKMNDKISIFASSERDVAASYTKNANVRAISEAKQPDSKAYDELNDLLESDSDLEYLKEAFDDFERDKENGLEDELLEDYVLESLEDLKTDFGYMSPKGHDIPDETVERVRDLVQRIDAPLKNGGGVYHGKIKMDNPLIVETQGSNWSAIPNDFKKTAGERTGTSTTREVTQYALDNDYDGVIFKELYDSGMYASEHTDRNTWGKSDIYCVFDSEQFKSADPVTRDNNGNIIPLSERGNEKSPDFRFSKFGVKGATGKQKELGIKAEQMFKDGKAVDKIWDETGWVVDTDGKAKMRFSDEDMSLKVKMKDLKKKSNAEIDTAMKRLDDIEDSINALRRAGKKDDDAEIQSLFGKMQDAYDDYDKAQYGLQEIPLGDLIEHEELFARYPKLADNVTVEFASKSYLDGADGWTERDGDNWRIVVRRGQNKNELTDTLVHEVQHVIQDVEGFSRGATPEEWQEITKEIRSRMDELKSDFDEYGVAVSLDRNGEVEIDIADEAYTNSKIDDFDSIENKVKEWKELKTRYDEMTGAYYGSPQGTRDSLAEKGEVQYHNTKGEWEARQAEEERATPKEFLGAYDAAEADELARGATGETYFTNRNEIKVEDYEQYSGTRKYSKMRQEKVQSARSKTRETEKEIAGVDKNLNGKITDARRKELEERRRTLEEQLEQEKIELNKLNRPVYQERLEKWEKELESLERQKTRARGDRLDEINRKITTAKSQITRNKNLIKNEPKKFVSDTPTNKLSDEELTKEYRDLTDNIQKEKWNEIRERDAINNRVESLRKEAEARDLDLRTNLERADDLVKDKGFGWQEAKKLVNEIRDINKQIAEIKSSGKLTMTKADKIRELKSESDAKGVRLTQVLDNSKSVIPEGKNPIDAFNETVGGNTLKEKGSGKKLNKMSAKKLIEENGSVGGAIKDVGRTIRRKTESSVIEFETAGKQLIRDGEKELGQALLDQTNNVIVYKNKAAAAVETRRASADGTKLGKSLNDVFKVKDKNGKTVDLLLEENAKMRTDLSNYLFAKHSFAREEQGKKVFGVIGEDGKPKWTNASTQEFMDAIVDKYGKETVDSFEKEIRGFIDYLNEYRLDTGLVSKELLDKLNDIYPYYIPTNRAVLNKPPKEYELPKTTAEVENGIKRAVGGDAPLEDLYTQLVKMTMATIRSGEQNKMLAMYAKAKGIESTRLPKDMTAEDVLDTAVTAFDSDHKGNWKIRFYDNGEAVTIPVNRHAAKGLREFNGQDYATLIEVSAKAGKLFHMREYKGLITDWNVVFGVRNGMRDAQQALVNSKDSYWYVRSIPRAMAAISNENNAFRALYDANGGRYSTLQQISRLDEIGALNKNKSTVAKGLQKIEDFNGMIEMKPRMQEFIGTIQKEADKILKDKGGLKGLMEQIEKEAGSIEASKRTEWIEQEYANRVVKLIQDNGKKDIIATAIRNSSDITVNFSRSGVVTKAFNAGFVPYLNPSVQGLSKMMRMFTESKSRGFGVLASFGAKLGVLTIAPAIVNEVLCQGNEAYQSLNTRDKDNNFFIPMSLFGGDKDKFIKIPKPRENAVLAEPFEYGFRYFMDKAQYGTADEWAQMFESAQANVGVVSVWEDNIFSPILNTALNRTWYGGDILSKQELKNIENDEAWKNFDETTTIFAKQMGKLANVSPKKVDAIMDSYLGLIYDFGISQTSQKNINDVYSSPKNFLKNNMFVQQFTKDAVFSNKYATKFWDKVDELNKGHVGDDDTIQKREYMAKYGYDTFTYDTAISGIDNDDKIPKEKKVAMKRELRKYKNQLIKRALDGEEVKYDPMQRIINLYKENDIKNATDKCLTAYAEGDHADAYKTLKRSKEYRNATPAEQRELQQKFLKTYKGIKRIARFSGDSDNFINYTTAEYVCVKNGYTGGLIANAYAGKSKKYAVEKSMEEMKRYIDAGYTEKNFKITMRALNRGANALGDEEKKYASQLDDYDKAMICAKNGYRDGAYLVAGAYIGAARMNAARCLTEGHSGEDFKWTDKRVNKFCKKYEIYQDKKEHTWDLEQVADAVRKEYGNKTPEEQAAVYTVITGDTEHNPFGEIGDYSHKNDSGLLSEEKKKGKGWYGRRGRGGRRGGGGGGGSSKGTVPKTESGAIKGTVSDPFSGIPRIGGRSGGSASTNTRKSNLNDAYRKRLAKLRKQ